jgi:hypothetical protein
MSAPDRIGFGDETLGYKLMVNFIRTLKEMAPGTGQQWREAGRGHLAGAGRP